MIDQEVIVFSAARTGSTFIWQCLSQVFKKVHKAHSGDASNLFQRQLPCIITERNRVEAFLSRVRVLRFKQLSSEEFIDKLDKQLTLDFSAPFRTGMHQDIDHYLLELHTVEYLKHCYPGKKLILQYEKFFNNYDYIFENIEAFFDIRLPRELADQIVLTTNLGINEERQGQFKNFDSHCDQSLIHGKHIISGEPDFYKNIIKAENYSRLHDMLWKNVDDWKKLYKVEQ